MQRGAGSLVRVTSSLAVLLIGAAVAGCDPTTGTLLPGAESGPVTPTDLRAGTVEVREVLIQEPRTGQSYRDGSVARMGVVLVNYGQAPDRLLGVQTPIASDTQLFADTTPQDNSYTPTAVPAVTAEPLTPRGPDEVPLYVELRDLTTSVREGQIYPVTFRFQKAGSVQAMVPVEIPKHP
jgi:copper(I)-binding protein